MDRSFLRCSIDVVMTMIVHSIHAFELLPRSCRIKSRPVQKAIEYTKPISELLDKIKRSSWVWLEPVRAFESKVASYLAYLSCLCKIIHWNGR